MAKNKYLSIITLNVNRLNAPIKKHEVAEWIRKHELHICCLQKTYLRKKDLHRLNVKGLKKILQANGQEKKSWGRSFFQKYIRQSRLENKVHKKIPRRTLHKTQGKIPMRTHKHCKYIWNQHGDTQIHKENLGGLQEWHRQQHTYTGVF